MRRYATWAGGMVLGLGLLLAGQPARAFIKQLTPLKSFLDDSQFIFSAKVDAADPKKPSVVLTVAEDLKDKAPFRRLPINMTGDKLAAENKHTEELFKRIAVNQPVVVFVNQRGKKYLAYGYTNGTWFQMTGEGDSPENVRWSLTHGEPFLRRTFKGTTEEMHKAVSDALADKAKPPDVDEKVEPGFGPEVKPEEKKPEEQGRLDVAGGPLFAVIPTAAIGGLVAILAMFFGFSGLGAAIKRWMVAVTVLSTNFTLFSVWWWFSTTIKNTWWGSLLALWTYMTVVVVIGLLWSWRRQLQAQQAATQEAATPATPGRYELITLATLTLLDLIGIALALFFPRWIFDADTSTFLIILDVGFWACLTYTVILWLVARSGRPVTRPPVTPEGVMIAGMGVGLLLFGVLTTTPAAAGPPPEVVAEDATGTAAEGPKFGRLAWQWKAPDGGVVYTTPALTKEYVFAAAQHGGAFPFGRLYCIDRASGQTVWAFDDDQEMKHVFSSPTVADGKVFIGEGFHQDAGCKLYCVEAATGRKLWAFETTSHTESTPVVWDGKVYFGAGDDGMYCLNAADGKEVWHLKNFHIDCNPTVVGGRVYAGSGVGDVYKDTAMFCLDATTGKQIWRMPTDLPVWGSPTVWGKHVFYGMGNGDYLSSSRTNPAGAVMCLEADTGRRLWEVKVGDGVLNQPAVDRHRVYFGSRDKKVYCVNRKDGTVAWEYDVGSPVVADVVLSALPGRGEASLFVAATGGQVYCLDPETGREDYRIDLRKSTNAEPAIYSSLAVEAVADEGGVRRQIVLGAGLFFGTSSGVVYCFEDAGPN